MFNSSAYVALAYRCYIHTDCIGVAFCVLFVWCSIVIIVVSSATFSNNNNNNVVFERPWKSRHTKLRGPRRGRCPLPSPLQPSPTLQRYRWHLCQRSPRKRCSRLGLVLYLALFPTLGIDSTEAVRNNNNYYISLVTNRVLSLINDQL